MIYVKIIILILNLILLSNAQSCGNHNMFYLCCNGYFVLLKINVLNKFNSFFFVLNIYLGHLRAKTGNFPACCNSNNFDSKFSMVV